jgi:hypothetical protein
VAGKKAAQYVRRKQAQQVIADHERKVWNRITGKDISLMTKEQIISQSVLFNGLPETDRKSVV